MKKLFVALLISAGLCGLASAQTVCGPYAPFGRFENPDGTWTVSMNASCQNPDPAQWSHTYTLIFPSTITYYNGTTLQFVGSASTYVEGHHDCVRSGRAGPCGVRLVTVDSASLTDPAGDSLPLVKVEVGSVQYPVDEWQSTTPLAPDTLYSFAVSGTDPDINPSTDVMHMQAIYQVVQPQPSGGGDD
jgi:hypothetical protein